MMSELSLAYADGFLGGLRKHAVSGAMYAQALQNAAARSGTRLAPKMMAQVAAQPRAKAAPFLASEARTPGALTPTHQQQQVQSIMERVPWAGSEHGGGGATAVSRFNNVLKQRGRAFSQPGVNKQITDAFGHAPGQGPRPNPLGFEPTVSTTGNTVAGVNREALTNPGFKRKVAEDKDAGLRQALTPFMLAGGLATGGGALAHHMKQPPPVYKTMVQSPTTNELPNFGKSLQQRTNRLDSILGTR